jgi:hypothetical protein
MGCGEVVRTVGGAADQEDWAWVASRQLSEVAVTGGQQQRLVFGAVGTSQ